MTSNPPPAPARPHGHAHPPRSAPPSAPRDPPPPPPHRLRPHPHPLGPLEYDGRVYQAHRDGRRVDVLSTTDADPPRCAILTPQAHADLTRTLESLDPELDYDYALGDQTCPHSDAPGAVIHLEGFRHSPFTCDELCCRPELAGVPLVYFHVFNNLHDTVLEVDGEPYLAVDPDAACP